MAWIQIPPPPSFKNHPTVPRLMDAGRPLLRPKMQRSQCEHDHTSKQTRYSPHLQIIEILPRPSFCYRVWWRFLLWLSVFFCRSESCSLDSHFSLSDRSGLNWLVIYKLPSDDGSGCSCWIVVVCHRAVIPVRSP